MRDKASFQSSLSMSVYIYSYLDYILCCIVYRRYACNDFDNYLHIHLHGIISRLTTNLLLQLSHQIQQKSLIAMIFVSKAGCKLDAVRASTSTA